MSTTARVLASIVVIVFFLSVAALEMLSERVRPEPASPTAAPAYLADAGLEP
jgi:hypothetical protein